MNRTLIGTTAIVLLAASGSAHAVEKINFMTSWRAQAEHGGYYQAVAKGFYQECGDEVTIRQGGPGVDGKQLLTAGAIDIMMAPFSETAMAINVAGYPAKAVAAFFQKNPQILMSHPGAGNDTLEEMKGKPIMIGLTSRSNFWPFLKAKYGYTDAQIRSYTGQIAPFLADKNAIQQALVTNEPHRIEVEAKETPKTFLLADYGYGAYASTMISSQALIDSKPAAVQCFVNASIKGWIDFMKNPGPAVDLIRKDNADNADDVVDYTVKMIKQASILEGPDTAKYGLGAMSEERWKSHIEMMQAADILPKDADFHQAYTLQFINKRFGM